jgi:plastocyanin
LLDISSNGHSIDPEQYIANLAIDRTSSMKPSILFHILLITSLIALAVPSYAGAVSASTTYVPGVKVGDWWNYGNFKTVGPAINVSGILLVVAAISGSNVTLKGTFVSGGNIQTQTFSGNLNTGAGNLTQFPPLVAANLGPGDHLFNSPSAPTFNNTITSTYAGATRQVNVVNITGTPLGAPSQVLYYDKSTGIELQIIQSSPGFSISFMVTGTNLWHYPISIIDDAVCSFNASACRFNPALATIILGSKVEWDNNGKVAHTVTSCSSSNNPPSGACPFLDSSSLPSFDSGAITAGANFTFTFRTVGTYFYYDAIHPWMHGTVIVQPNATAVPGFTFQASPSSLNLQAGNSGSIQLIVTAVNGFSGFVAVTTTVPMGQGFPTITAFNVTGNLGVGGSFSTFVYVKTTLVTANGVYTVLSTASGGIFRSIQISVTVTGGSPSFSISINPTTVTAPFNSFFQPPLVTITSLNGFTGAVNLETFVSPPGLLVTLHFPFNVTQLTLGPNGTNMTTLTPVVLPSTPSGIYNVTVVATSGLLRRSANATVIVPQKSIGDFGIKANPTSLIIRKAGINDPFAIGVSTISLTSVNGFSGTVTLSGTPTGFLGETFNPNQVPLTANSSANASLILGAGNTPPGTYFVTVTGTSGSISHSVTLTVQVVIQPDFQLFISIPPGGNIVFAGGSTSVGVQLFSTGISSFNGTVTLSGQVSPLVSNGPTLSFNPTQITFAPTGTPFSQLTISTTASTPPGNYTITVKGTSGTLVHTFQLQLTVLPVPVLTLSPTSGPVGTQVKVHGSGFLNPSVGPFFSPVEIQITFDDQLVGFFFIQGNSFNFTFDVPDAQAGIVHQVHAKEVFPSSLDVQASFLVLPEPSTLTVSVSAGTIYFPGDTAIIFATTSLNGQQTTVTSLQLTLVRPNGSNITLNAVLVTPGVYKASYVIPSTGSLGTYAVIVNVHQAGSSDRSALASFEVKPTWLQANGRNLITATSIVGAVGMLGVVALAWRKGYFTRREDEFPIP